MRKAEAVAELEDAAWVLDKLGAVSVYPHTETPLSLGARIALHAGRDELVIKKSGAVKRKRLRSGHGG